MVSNRLKDKVALITASTDGIGLAIAKRYLEEGAKVVICSRKQENVDRALSELREIPGLDEEHVRGQVCHVNNAEDRQQIVDFTLHHFSAIDILFLNAGVNPANDQRISKASETLWMQMLKTNTISTCMLMNLVLPHMKAKKRGKIVTMSSICAFNSQIAMGAYAVSKAAVCALTKLYSQEFASSNIQVNCLAPGPVRTKMLERASDKQLLAAIQLVPAGRMCDPSEIAGVAVMLACEDSDYISGETICITGGMQSRL